MKTEELKSILTQVQDVRVAVYGDFCLDVYWDVDPKGSEVSVETGLQAEAVTSQRYSPGGAGNIVANLAALSPKEIKVIGTVGDDPFGRELVNQLKRLGAHIDGLILQQEHFDTYAYIKKMYGVTEAPRIDFGLKNKRHPQTDALLLKAMELALATCDVFIFNQQVVGSIPNPAFIKTVNALFNRFGHKPIIVDSRHYNSQFQGVYRKSNEIETAVLNGKQATPQDHLPLAKIKEHGEQVYQTFKKPLFVTCGERGILVFDQDGTHKIEGLQINTKIDTVGAGDTTLSAIALSLGAGIAPAIAARFANIAAGVTVQKLHTTGTASPNEILEIGKDPNYNYRPELANDLRLANYNDQSEIEVCNDAILAQLGRIKHVVFDHDGTISTQREGWEKVMAPVMVQAILGDRFASIDKTTYDTVQERVLEFIDKSTGIQTIVQMEGLIALVRSFGFVPEKDIKDKFAYKESYNNALMQLVNARSEKLRTGELNVTDFTLKGAVSFLHMLKQKGMTLYLASGTDKQDVINEATSLGYANVFEGRIYGAVGDIAEYSKKKVIQNIIAKNRLDGKELLVIGDGPVEIREGKKAAGITIGVASDEVRRYGLHVEKRKRLIKAGADMIISDYAQTDVLFKLLFPSK
ncbi:MAG: PfkB family carbohydrate kinase [Bacteroidota bacterium]